jgi:hypothetical protein
VSNQHELQPHLVHGEVFERELGHAGVLVVADLVLDAGTLALAALEHGDVGVGLVGEECLEAVAIVVGEGQLRAGMRALAAADKPRALRPGGEVEKPGELADPSLAWKRSASPTSKPISAAIDIAVAVAAARLA